MPFWGTKVCTLLRKGLSTKNYCSSVTRRSPALMSAVLLACFDRKRQVILPGWKRAGREFRKSAGRTVGFVKVNDHSARGVGRINVQVSPRGIGLFAARVVRKDHERSWLALFRNCIQPIRLAINFKRHGARRLFPALHAEDVDDRHPLWRIVRFKARLDAPLLISRIRFDSPEVRSSGIVFVFDANSELVATFDDLQAQRTEVQDGGFVVGIGFEFEGSNRLV